MVDPVQKTGKDLNCTTPNTTVLNNKAEQTFVRPSRSQLSTSLTQGSLGVEPLEIEHPSHAFSRPCNMRKKQVTEGIAIQPCGITE